MKIYGRSFENGELLELSETSIVASAEELRALAAFFSRAADRKEGVVDNTTDHMHFRDFCPDWTADSADMVIMTIDI